MEKIRRSIRRAQRKMLIQHFLAAVSKTLFAGLAVAGLALLYAKIRVIPFPNSVWTWSWIGGAALWSLLVSLVWSYWRRPDETTAALEIDRRCDLQQRVTSSLSLSRFQRNTPAGQALLADTSQKLQHIDLQNAFSLPAARLLRPRTIFLPVLLIFLTLLPNRIPDRPAIQEQTEVDRHTQTSLEKLKKHIEQLRLEARNNGFSQTERMLENIETEIENLKSEIGMNLQETLIELNRLAELIRQQLFFQGISLEERLKNLKETESGPIDEAVKAMKSGNYSQAAEELKPVRKQLEHNVLTQHEKNKLKNQLRRLKKKIQQAANPSRQNPPKQSSQQTGATAKQNEKGSPEQAPQASPRTDTQEETMTKMTRQIQQAVQGLEQGNLRQTSSAMAQLEQSLEELERLREKTGLTEKSLEKISQSKRSLTCRHCNGQGCRQCGGDAFAQQESTQDSDRISESAAASGTGNRPEQATETELFRSRVSGKLGREKFSRQNLIVIGQQPGKSLVSQAREVIKDTMVTSKQEKPSALTGGRIPRKQRQHVREYFELIHQKP